MDVCTTTVGVVWPCSKGSYLGSSATSTEPPCETRPARGGGHPQAPVFGGRASGQIICFPARQLPNKTTLTPGERHQEAHAAESNGPSLSALWGRRRSHRMMPFLSVLTHPLARSSVPLPHESHWHGPIGRHVCLNSPTRALFSGLQVPGTGHGFKDSCFVVHRQLPTQYTMSTEKPPRPLIRPMAERRKRSCSECRRRKQKVCTTPPAAYTGSTGPHSSAVAR